MIIYFERVWMHFVGFFMFCIRDVTLILNICFNDRSKRYICFGFMISFENGQFHSQNITNRYETMSLQHIKWILSQTVLIVFSFWNGQIISFYINKYYPYKNDLSNLEIIDIQYLNNLSLQYLTLQILKFVAMHYNGFRFFQTSILS